MAFPFIRVQINSLGTIILTKPRTRLTNWNLCIKRKKKRKKINKTRLSLYFSGSFHFARSKVVDGLFLETQSTHDVNYVRKRMNLVCWIVHGTNEKEKNKEKKIIRGSLWVRCEPYRRYGPKKWKKRNEKGWVVIEWSRLKNNRSTLDGRCFALIILGYPFL